MAEIEFPSDLAERPAVEHHSNHSNAGFIELPGVLDVDDGVEYLRPFIVKTKLVDVDNISAPFFAFTLHIK